MTATTAGRRVAAAGELAGAAWRTWGGRGLARRSAYEAARRTGALGRAEARWQRGAPAPDHVLRFPALGAPDQVSVPSPAPEGITLYGGLPLDSAVPPAWHRHPLTGHAFAADAHWMSFSDANPATGDIKDVWELSRMGWLHPRLRLWAATGDEEVAESVWRVVEDWHSANPPYLGPHWMCGQEASLRAITVMGLADALDPSPRTSDARRRLVGRIVTDAVGRVAPTLGYALSQRNNHATSEAGFLWTATVRAPWLPGADRLRRRAARALSEAVADQVADDGSYAQHSPTYHRLALHVLLWCLAVGRSAGMATPDGVAAAVDRSVGHLGALLVPGSEGQVPNLGGNDGALLFDLAPTAISDLRPVLAHAAAAVGQWSGLPAGPWDEEASWFGLEAVAASPPVTRAPSRTTHALTRGTAHAVLRAGPLRHRPAHADQLHVDVWLGGEVVAVDPGSYRYTAPSPWGNALAGDEVHNLPRPAGHPQATRAGPFFWRTWRVAEVVGGISTREVVALRARLALAEGVALERLVAVGDGLVVVVDCSSAAGELRWNLPWQVDVEVADGLTLVSAGHWAARVVHHGQATVPSPRDDVPASGWHSPTYGLREPLTAVVAPFVAEQVTVTAFATGPARSRLTAVTDAAGRLDLGDLDPATIEALVSPGGSGPGWRCR